MFRLFLTNLSPYFSIIKAVSIISSIVALSTIVGVHLYHDRSVHKQLDRAEALNISRETQIKALADKQQFEIAAATKLSNELALNAINEKDAAIKALGFEHINRLELTKRIEALNESDNRKLADTKFNFNERLRLEGINSTTAMRQESERQSSLPASASERDRTAADYNTLKEACQLTTIDFNACRESYDADTAACGREK